MRSPYLTKATTPWTAPCSVCASKRPETAAFPLTGELETSALLIPFLAEELLGGLVGCAPSGGSQLEQRVLLRADCGERLGSVLRLPAGRQVELEA